MPNLLKLKRGTAATIPVGSAAEPLFTTDTYDLYIGKGNGSNQRFQKYIASGTSSQFLKGDGSLDSTSYQTALTFSSPLVNTSGTISIPAATGSVNGYLTSTDWTTFNSKEPAITAGTSLQYYRGDKTFQTLNTSVVPESGAIYFTEPRVLATVLTGLNLSGGGTIAATDSVLTAFGKIQNQISGIAGGVSYQTTWNASTNTPTLTSSVGTKGYYYVVSVAGSTNLNGITDWKVGDWAIFNGTAWDKVDNTDAVSSVNGFTGAVNLGLGDISNVTLSSPTNGQLLRFNGTSSKWENWTPTYISGNQTITLSGDVSGSGTTAITTTIGALKVTNAMLAGTIDYAKMDATTVPTWNQNTTGSAATLTTARTLTIGSTGKTFNGSANVSWTLAEIGAFANPMTTLGDIIYGGASGAATRLAGNTVASKRFLTQTGDGTNSAAPSWGTIVAADVPTLNQNTTGSAATLTTARNFTINGTAKSFDGSANVSWTAAEIGLTSYLPLTGGTLTGALSGTSASFSSFITAQSTGGSGLRIYGSSGTNQWDIYLNSTNLRFSDNTGTGSIVFDRPLSGTSATFSSSVSIGGADQGYNLDVKRSSTGDSTFDTVANFYKASTHNTGLLIRLKNTIVDLAANNITGGGGPTAGMSFSVSSGGSISTALTLASTGAATFSSSVQTYRLKLVESTYSTNFTLYTGVDNSNSIGFYNETSGVYNLKIASTGAATFSSSVTAAGNAATNSAIIANNAAGASGTSQYYIDFTAGATTIGRIFRGNGASGVVANGLNIDNFDGFQVRLNQLGGSGGTFSVTGGAATFSSSVTIQGGNALYVNNAANTRSGSLATTASGTELSSHNGAGEPLLLKAPDTTAYMAFSTAGSERMRITSGGNVGIGTTSPDNKLTVWGTNNALNSSQGNINVYTSESAAIDTGGSIGLGGYYFGTTGYIPFANITGKKENSTDNNAAGYLAFLTRNGTTGTGERMRITSGGRVIVGTNSSNALEVFSDGDTEIGFSYATRGNVYAKIIGDVTNASPLGGEIAFQTATGGTLTERMRITSGGATQIKGTLQTYAPGSSSVLGDTWKLGGFTNTSVAPATGYLYVQVNGASYYIGLVNPL